MRWLLALTLAVAACDLVVPPPVPNMTCADWRFTPDGDRLAIARAIVRAEGLHDAVRTGQQVDRTVIDDELHAMAAATVTKNCEIQQWDAGIEVRALLRDVYGRSQGG
jgi:hypothetical protein